MKLTAIEELLASAAGGDASALGALVAAVADLDEGDRAIVHQQVCRVLAGEPCTCVPWVWKKGENRC